MLEQGLNGAALIRGRIYHIRTPLGRCLFSTLTDLVFSAHTNCRRPLALNDWTQSEVRAIVRTYLRMLTLELSGQHYVKAKLNRELLKELNSRTPGSVEFKHCNISAALTELGMPSIHGYKPRFNFQRRAIFIELSQQLPAIADLDQAACSAVEMPAYAPDVGETEFGSIVVKAPQSESPETVDELSMPRVAKRDYLAMESRNRSLGLAGERLVGV